jgi:Salmonella virulence plasmid 65kDa B protein
VQTDDPKVDGATGAFTQQIPLDIPPGRNGVQPDVTLDYNSQRTKDSIVGYGWALSVPYIERENKTGSQNLYGNTPYFTSSIDGELANSTSTANTPTSLSIMDSLPLGVFYVPYPSTGDSQSYTVPIGGVNKLFLVLVSQKHYHSTDRNT